MMKTDAKLGNGVVAANGLVQLTGNGGIRVQSQAANPPWYSYYHPKKIKNMQISK